MEASHHTNQHRQLADTHVRRRQSQLPLGQSSLPDAGDAGYPTDIKVRLMQTAGVGDYSVSGAKAAESRRASSARLL